MKEGREETVEGLDLRRSDRTQKWRRRSQKMELLRKEEVLVVMREDMELFSEAAGSFEIAGKWSRLCENSSQNLETDLLYVLIPPFLDS